MSDSQQAVLCDTVIVIDCWWFCFTRNHITKYSMKNRTGSSFSIGVEIMYDLPGLWMSRLFLMNRIQM